MSGKGGLTSPLWWAFHHCQASFLHSLSFFELISGPPSPKFRFIGIEVHPITGTQTCWQTLYSLTFPTNFTQGLMIKWNFVRHLTVHLYGKE